MRKALLIALSLVLALVGWSLVCAQDFYVIPVLKTKFAPVPKTGQTTSYAGRDDGALERGMPWPTPRLVDNGNGTVTDRLTGLIWLQNANCLGEATWQGALTFAGIVRDGICDLKDGSSMGDWRLPNLRELHSLIDYGR